MYIPFFASNLFRILNSATFRFGRWLFIFITIESFHQKIDGADHFHNHALFVYS